jgi:hypothetical protein
MTKDEIIKELDLLKDLTNDAGKGMLERLKTAVSALTEPAPTPAPVAPTPAPVDRRSEERDPFEADQKKAEELGLPVLKR